MEKACAVIITYYPNVEIIENLQSIYYQVDRIVIVDNTPNKKPEVLLKMSPSFSNVEIIYNIKNLGIAKALNQGFEIAINDGFNWVLTMDQDSTLSKNMIKRMFEIYFKIKDKQRKQVWAITPSFLDKITSHNTILSKVKEEKQYTFVNASLTSGMLVKCAAYKKLGNFNEKYFIYHVDTEYCFRANTQGFKLLHTPKIKLLHSEGFQTRHSFLWKKNILATNHSPIARYYMNRNVVKLTKTYLFKDFIATISIVKSQMVSNLKVIFFEKQKLIKIFYIIKGLISGIIL